MRLARATHDLVVSSHHVRNRGTGFMLGAWIGASCTSVGRIFSKAMGVAVVHAYFTNDNHRSNLSRRCSSGSSNGGSSNLSCIGRSRNNVCLIGSMETGSLGGELAVVSSGCGNVRLVLEGDTIVGV